MAPGRADTWKRAGPHVTGITSAVLGFGSMRLGAVVESYLLVLLAFGLLFNAIYWLFYRERARPVRWPTRA